jgi:hypothetical protein
LDDLASSIPTVRYHPYPSRREPTIHTRISIPFFSLLLVVGLLFSSSPVALAVPPSLSVISLACSSVHEDAVLEPSELSRTQYTPRSCFPWSSSLFSRLSVPVAAFLCVPLSPLLSCLPCSLSHALQPVPRRVPVFALTSSPSHPPSLRSVASAWLLPHPGGSVTSAAPTAPPSTVSAALSDRAQSPSPPHLETAMVAHQHSPVSRKCSQSTQRRDIDPSTFLQNAATPPRTHSLPLLPPPPQLPSSLPRSHPARRAKTRHRCAKVAGRTTSLRKSRRSETSSSQLRRKTGMRRLQDWRGTQRGGA